MKTFKIVLFVAVFSVGLLACGGGGSKQEVKHADGKLIGSKLVAEYSDDAVKIQGLESKYSVKVYRVIYETKDVQGQYIQVSGIVSIPTKTPQVKSPIILYHHGTMYENSEAPTESVHQGASWVIPSYLGFITVAPDYIGYGKSHGILHPYLNSKITASTSIDLLRSVKTLLKTLKVRTNDQLFLGGYSQGGGAVLASQRLLEAELENEFTVTASSAGAGGYALSNELIDVTRALLEDYEDFHIVRPSNIGFILKAMDAGYNLNIIDKVFKSKFIDVVNSVYDGNSNSVEIDKLLSHNANELLNRDFLQRIVNGEEKALVDAFKDNDLIDWVPKAPTQLFHGKEDDWVNFSHSQMAFDKMLFSGAMKLQLVECITPNNESTNHSNCFFPYLLSSYQFFVQYADDL